VALVFVLSIDDATNERNTLEDLKQLQDLSTTEYQSYVKKRVAAEVGDDLMKSAAALREALDQALADKDLRVLATSRISDVFGEPAHIGRLKPEDLRFKHPETTLDELDHLWEKLPLDRDVQVVIGNTKEALPKIVDFLESSSLPGPLGPNVDQVTNVQLSPSDSVSDVGETFLPGDLQSVQLVLSFDLQRDSLSPVFSNLVPGTLLTIQDSSWLHWLKEQNTDEQLFTRSGHHVRWLPGITGDRRTQGLGDLRRELETQIATTMAKNQTIKLPGVSVPGFLALAAIPLALLGLLGTVVAYSAHLRGLAADNQELFREFAWAPLAPQGLISFTATLGSLLVLPTLVLSLLLWKSAAFEAPRLFSLTWVILATVSTLALGVVAVRILADLRSTISASRD